MIYFLTNAVISITALTFLNFILILARLLQSAVKELGFYWLWPLTWEVWGWNMASRVFSVMLRSTQKFKRAGKPPKNFLER